VSLRHFVGRLLRTILTVVGIAFGVAAMIAHVAVGLLLDGKRMSDVRPRVEHVLELVGLADRRRHRPDELSGGQMQRVAIARALVIEFLLLLADEPTGNLDTRTGAESLQLIRDTADRLGQTIVMVTHDPRAASHGDRASTMRDGQIIEDAPPA
jgi:putative ABC transport system ATP-binding protein